MKCVTHGGLAVALVLGLAAVVMAEEAALPWKTGDAPKADAPAAPPAPAAPAAGDPAPGATTPAEGTTPAGGASAKVEKAAAPVKKILGQVEVAQKQIDEEMAKPAEKQNAMKLRGLKETIARTYLTAAQTAKAQSGVFKGDEKQAFLDQYDKPNREKAISLILELARESELKRDYRNAEALTKQALSLDPNNADAQALLKQITEEKAAPVKSTKTDKKDLKHLLK